VAIIDTQGVEDPSQWSVVAFDTTDANGEWSVSGLDASAVGRYHAVAQYDDGSSFTNFESLPYLSTPADVFAPETPVTVGTPTPAVEVASAIPDSGVFRYDFEDTTTASQAVDSFDNNPINLSLNGPTYSTNARFGSNSLDYDGSGDTADTDTFGGINSHTFSAFVFPTDLSVSRSVGLFLDGGERSFTIQSDGSVGWGGGTNAGFFSTSSGVVSTGTYTHIMWYYDDSNGERRIYVDNRLEAEDTDSEATLNNTNHRIGYGNIPPTNPFVGQLDLVDFYDKPLNSTERSNLYNNGNI
jgi:hypothetical protein